MDAELILMESIVVAIITACATVLAVVVTEVLFGKRTFNLLEKHVDISDTVKTEVLNSSATHYQRLTDEHKRLLSLQESLKEQAERTAMIVGNTGKDLSKEVQKIYVGMREEKIEQRNRYENLTDRQRTIADSIITLSAVSDEMQQLSLENAGLRAQNEKLLGEQAQLKEQIKALETTNQEWEVEYNALIVDVNKQIASRDKELQRLQKPNHNKDFGMEI